MKSSILTITVVLLACCSIMGQDLQKVTLFDSAEILDSAYNEYAKDSADYKLAIEILENVHESDTNFDLVQYRKAYYHHLDSNYTTSIALCNYGIKNYINRKDDFYNLKGLSLKNSEQYEKAIEHYDACIKEYPTNYLYYTNKAQVYKTLERFQEAYDSYKLSVKYNPFFAHGYNMMGYILSLSGQVTASGLCYHSSLFVKPKASNAYNVILYVEQVTTSKVKKVDSINIVDPDIPAYFKSIDRILNSRTCISSNYKTKSELNYNIIKTIQLICEKLEDPKNDQGFYNRYIIRNFYDMWKDEVFEPYSYRIFESLENEYIQGVVSKKQNEVEKFNNWIADTYLANVKENLRTVEPGKTTQKTTYYNSNFIYGQGEFNPTTAKNTGQWVYYFEGGNKMSEGAFNEQGERNGLWNWFYENGNKKESLVYEDGTAAGDYSFYNKIGIKTQEYTYNKNGKIDGIVKLFDDLGNITDSMAFEEGMKQGISYEFFPNGTIQRYFAYKDNKLNGPTKTFYINGTLRYDGSCKDNFYSGKFTEYSKYNPKQIVRTGNYVEGDYEGKWTFYHDNGQLRKEVVYKEGVETGKIVSYNSDGSIETEKELDESGKYNGTIVYHDIDGKPYEEVDYKKGDVIEYRAIGVDGKIIKTFEKENKEVKFTGYFARGDKRVDGLFNKEGRHGKWTYYKGESVAYTREYEDGVATGPYQSYLINGNTQKLYFYKEGNFDSSYVNYYINEQIRNTGYYVNGLLEGPYVTRNWYGDTTEINFYREGDLSGRTMLFDYDNNLTTVYHYYKDYFVAIDQYDAKGAKIKTDSISQEQTTIVSHFPNGKKYIEKGFKNGYRHGKSLYYNGLGQLISTGHYNMGLADGEWRWYYGNTKKLETSGDFLLGDRIGTWLDYWPNGNLKRTRTYEFGELNSSDSSFYENGKVRMVSEYKNSNLHGKRTNFNQNGEVICYRYYFQGDIVGCGYPDHPKGKDFVVRFPNGTGSLKAFYKNKQPAADITYKNGELHGKYTMYHAGNKPYIAQKIEYGFTNGVRKEYYPTGKLKASETFYYDNKNGASKYYHPNGKLKSVINYANDEKHGEAKIYDESGKLLTTQQWYDDYLMSEN